MLIFLPVRKDRRKLYKPTSLIKDINYHEGRQRHFAQKDLLPSDSTIFMNNGGTGFTTTVENGMPAHIKNRRHVLYSGGEFSMERHKPGRFERRRARAMEDTGPIHQVYIVDPFYMDGGQIFQQAVRVESNRL